MAACDSKYRFTFVDIGDYGRYSDGGVFANSELGKQLEAETLPIPGLHRLPESDVELPHVFVADEAFPLRHTLMRPFPGSKKGILSEEKRIFNYRLSRARRTIENAFGILAARWRIFEKPIQAEPENAESIVQATIALHNYLLKTDHTATAADRYIPPAFVGYEDGEGQMKRGEWENIINGNKGMRRIGATHAQVH